MSDKKRGNNNNNNNNESDEELRNKFQRLLQEYTKIKNQNSILKKAVIQEQQKNKDLEVQVKEKEVAIRSTLEENELLNFNNQRLTKRIQILQSEIVEHAKNVESSGWFGKKTDLRTKQDLEVATQELAVKIEENERLHIKIFEQSQSYKSTLADLDSQISQMKRNLQLNEEQFSIIKTQQQTDLEKFEIEMKNSNDKISSLENNLQSTLSMMEANDEENARIKKQLENELNSTQDLIKRKLSYDDTRYQEYNKYNIPPLPRSLKRRGVGVIKEGISNIENITKGLKEFYYSFLKRVGSNYKILETHSAEENVPQLLHAHQQLQKIANVLPDLLQKICDCFLSVSRQYVDKQNITSQSKIVLSQSISQFVIYNSQISSYYSLIVQIENNAEDFKERNLLIVEKYSLIYQSFEIIASYLSSFFPNQESSGVEYCESNYTFLLEKISNSILRLQNAFNEKKEFFGLVRGEVEIESQNIFYRPENKTNNQNLLSTQDFLSSHFDKLSNNVQTYLTEIQTISHESQLVRGTKGNVNYSSSIERRAQKFANFVNSQADWTSVPYEEAVMNITFIKEVEQKKEYYESTISHCKLKLTEEEKDKQRILIELSQTKDALASKQSQMNSLLTELASSRQQYENLRVLLEQKEHSSSESSPISTSFNEELKKLDMINESLKLAASNKKETETRYTLTVIDENGDQQNSLNVSQLDKERESALKEHYKAKRAQLLSQLKEVDAKALKYYFELEKTLKELNQSKLDISDCKQHLSDSLQNLRIAQDDLERTRVNYDDQMKMLTEHFGKLNDQIADKEDLLTKLKSHKVHCGRCGIWNTVSWLITEGNNGRRCSRGNHPSSYNFS